MGYLDRFDWWQTSFFGVRGAIEEEHRACSPLREVRGESLETQLASGKHVR